MAADIRSVMNNSVSNTVIIEFYSLKVYSVKYCDNRILFCYHRILHTVINYRPNTCSHTTTVLTIHRCILIGYFNNCNFSKHE